VAERKEMRTRQVEFKTRGMRSGENYDFNAVRSKVFFCAAWRMLVPWGRHYFRLHIFEMRDFHFDSREGRKSQVNSVWIRYGLQKALWKRLSVGSRPCFWLQRPLRARMIAEHFNSDLAAARIRSDAARFSAICLCRDLGSSFHFDNFRHGKTRGGYLH